MQQYLEVGKIINTHGINGEVKVIPLTDDPRRFYKLRWA
ncbi:MAG TPA: 16S rRNA processing protein RimM, partial [Clostridiaceae bacterium]|nr:16S rRNA processing protein RimM [Clostridiaceae bacterium]